MSDKSTNQIGFRMRGNTAFILMRFKPRCSAVLQIFFVEPQKTAVVLRKVAEGQARGNHFSTGEGVNVKNQLLSCDMIRCFHPIP